MSRLCQRWPSGQGVEDILNIPAILVACVPKCVPNTLFVKNVRNGQKCRKTLEWSTVLYVLGGFGRFDFPQSLKNVASVGVCRDTFYTGLTGK